MKGIRLSLPYKWRAATVVAGGMLLHMVFGMSYTFGNFDVYIASYMRYKGSAPSLTYTECSWIFVAEMSSEAVVISFAGILESKLGIRLTSLLGGWTISLGVILSYWTIQQSFGALVFTQGVMFGVGTGISYMLPLTCAMKWMPNNPGLANGLVNGGIGVGAIIINFVETYFINPDNKNEEKQVNGEKYFDQADVLEQVPKVFLLLGGVFATMQLVGCLLMRNPPALQTTEVFYTKYNASRNDVSVPLQNGPEEKNDVTTPLLNNRMKSNDVRMPLVFIDEKENKKRKTFDVETYNTAEDYETGRVMTPLQALKTLDFYLLYFTFFCDGLGVVFLSVLYKAYGLSFINDDVFLTIVGTFSSVFNMGGRLFWGHLADKTSFKFSSILMNCAITILMLTLQLTELTTNKYLFLIYICLLVGAGMGCFTTIPAKAAKRFGKKHITTINGMIYTSQILNGPLTIVIAQSLRETLGWIGLFFLVAALSGIGLMLSFMFNAKDTNENVSKNCT